MHAHSVSDAWIAAIAAVVFWGGVAELLYAYFLYPVVLFCLYSLTQLKRDLIYLMERKDRRVFPVGDVGVPRVSIIIPAYNEAAHLEQTLNYLKKLYYPKDNLEIIVASDGSTDGTNEILARHTDSEIKPLVFVRREGKASTLNRAVRHATGKILVFSDASTQLAPDAVHKLVRHFADSEVGVVCGSLKFVRSVESTHTEGVYWRYESILRLMEARLGATLTASGALYAVRRECFRPLPSDALIDDLLVPMAARRLGFRVVYDPEAIATEFAASGVSDEAVRRTRLALGSFRALPELLGSHLPLMTFFAFISHKLLRWLVPFVMLALLLSGGWLAVVSGGILGALYRIAFAAQIAFYGWACVGAVFRDAMCKVPFGLTGYFMVAMNLAFLRGFLRYLRTEREGTWERVS
jgi:cellulose synthase/poly-beta-1,6-N-acetylglucosamine synthase-like glycosyltransferase